MAFQCDCGSLDWSGAWSADGTHGSVTSNMTGQDNTDVSTTVERNEPCDWSSCEFNRNEPVIGPPVSLTRVPSLPSVLHGKDDMLTYCLVL